MAYFRKDQAAYWSFLYLSLARTLRNVSLILASITLPALPVTIFPLWDSYYFEPLANLSIGSFSLIIAISAFTLLLNEIRRTRAIVRSVLDGGDAAGDALRRADPD